MNNLPQSISQLHSDLKAKKYSCVDLVNSYLERIKKYDKDLNSFLTITSDQAYKKAKICDKVISDNPNAFSEFPLLGVVVAHKDLFSTKGTRTTAGSKVLESYVPSYSATVVKRLDSKGAIMIGKTNQDAWGHGSSGENSDFGPTKNPWNTDFVPGGSSSGSAAAVSSDFALFSTGTDTGSSVRLPASFTNLVGLKPTYGSVSRYGVIAFASSMDTIGHLTKSVQDSRTVFNITSGTDLLDSNTIQKKQKSKDPKKTTIGIPKEFFQKGLDPEVEKKTLEAIGVFKSLGISFKEISLPHTEYGVAVYYILAPAETSSNLARFDGVRFGNKRETFGGEAKRRIMLGSFTLSAGYKDAYYKKAMMARTEIVEDFKKAFEKVDAIIAPTSPTPPFKLGEKTQDPLKMYLSDIYTVTANLAGIPSLAIPAGFSSGSLPIGIQLMGDQLSENTLFSLGELFQNHTNHHKQKPNLALPPNTTTTKKTAKK
jgi:aspartyl-tRNA(Asn)/glutamyl-tRNA(Gln) amidotransferase subunit A